jgi:integrase
MRQLAMDGENPIAERKWSREPIPTFREAAKTVHAEHKSSWRNAKHQAQWINTLKTYAFPQLGDLPVSAIGSADVVEALSPIWLKKPETAKRVRQRIGTVLDWAKAKGYRDTENPVRAVLRALPKPPRAEKHHASLPYAELPGFLRELRSQDANVSTRLALEFLILTATRTSEVLQATWSEIDLAAKEWTVPAERMKAKREFRVPLTDRALEVLKEARRLGDGAGYVFPGQNTDKPLSQMALLMLLRRMKLKITTHGFRSTFRDWAAEQTNFPREVCESALAHTVKNKTEAAYLRTDQFAKRRKLMDAWSRFAMTTKKAEVLPIKATA